MKKTVIDWFNCLDEPYKSQAIENLTIKPESEFDSLNMALLGAFSWLKTNQGNHYWYKLWEKL